MADKKISELTNIVGADLADADEFVVVDASATETKAITWAEIKNGLDTSTGFVRITGDTMTGALVLSADPTTGLEAATKQYVDGEITSLIDAAPAALDTLNELAAALGDDANFSTTITNSLATKLPLAGGTMTGDITFAGTQLFDGRDVSADGSKLDGIEALADVTDTANVTAAGALMDSEVTSLSGIKTLTVPDATTISTFGATLVDDLDAAAARTTLGLGTAATTASTDYATAAQGTNADTAYSWGNHAVAGYLTSFSETDPIYTASSWYTTTNNASNWDTAYSWGDHAVAGYGTTDEALALAIALG